MKDLIALGHLKDILRNNYVQKYKLSASEKKLLALIVVDINRMIYDIDQEFNNYYRSELN